jgi:hypothetical protein
MFTDLERENICDLLLSISPEKGKLAFSPEFCFEICDKIEKILGGVEQNPRGCNCSTVGPGEDGAGQITWEGVCFVDWKPDCDQLYSQCTLDKLNYDVNDCDIAQKLHEAGKSKKDCKYWHWWGK